MAGPAAGAAELGVRAARVADEKQGRDTIVLSVGAVLGICDVFVITSAPNTRLVRTITDEVEKRLKDDAGIAPLRVEGLRDLQWVLLDYGDLAVHVFLQEARDFYDVERLYRDVPTIEWRAETAPAADRPR